MSCPRDRRSLRVAAPALIFLGLVAVMDATAALAAEFVVGADGRSEVIFTSKAPLESFDGKTNSVSGSIVADLDRLVGSVAVYLVVDLADLDTGISMRNKHMRENHLETEIYPLATFTGGEVLGAEPEALRPGQSARIRLSGTLDLHGVNQPREIEVKLELTPAGELLIEAEFPVSLAAHEIERPSFLVMKLADEQQVRIALRAVPTEK